MNRKEFHTIKDQKRWGAYAATLLNDTSLTLEFKEHFGSFWIEAGHHMREQIADDRILVRLLRHLLPPHTGEALKLFRGENRGRWETGAIGLAWTTDIETARMFGRGLNAVCSGGVLLTAHADPSAVISGPNSHSNWLNENQFTVDPLALTSILVSEYYPTVL